MEKSKSRAVESFVAELQGRLGEKIRAIYLFGSTAKGTDVPESDIDLLVVYSGVNERALLEVASQISFKIVCELGELIQTVPMSKEEFEESLGRSPFLWEVLEFGQPIFTKMTETEWELDFGDYLELAREFLEYAKDALKDGKLRLAIDTGYNASELLAKAMIISTGNSLASSHGGIVGQFGKLFVLTSRLDAHFGRDLNLSLDLRGKARYKPRSQLSKQDAEFVIDLAEKLLTIAEKLLR
ncbi:MAG: HEPN domain-containing protein [bacterium]